MALSHWLLNIWCTTVDISLFVVVFIFFHFNLFVCLWSVCLCFYYFVWLTTSYRLKFISIIHNIYNLYLFLMCMYVCVCCFIDLNVKILEICELTFPLQYRLKMRSLTAIVLFSLLLSQCFSVENKSVRFFPILFP